MRVVFRKWGERPHWEYDALRLGDDEHGTWVGVRAGTRLSRPGVDFATPQHFVSLVPHDEPFVATFYDALCADGTASAVDVYVDITTAPLWSHTPVSTSSTVSTGSTGSTVNQGSTVSMVDLDLDVVRGRSGRVWVDDEDEFADHRVRFGYPADVVRLAVTTCERVQAAVVARTAPFDGVAGATWLRRLALADAS